MQKKAPNISYNDIKTQNEYIERVKGWYMARNEKPLANIVTFGCQQNENDSERIKGLLNQKRLKSVTETNDKIIRCLTENVEKNLNLEQISKLTGISVTHMKRTFKKHHDGGIIDYFILMKIDEAKKMITETELSFTEISDTLGFSSSAYFSRTFRKKTGLTPSEYLRKVNKIAEDEAGIKKAKEKPKK